MPRNILQEARPIIKPSSVWFFVYCVLHCHLQLNGRVRRGSKPDITTYAEIANVNCTTIQNARRITAKAVAGGWVERTIHDTDYGRFVHLRPTEKLFDIIPGVFDEPDQDNYWSGDIPYAIAGSAK